MNFDLENYESSDIVELEVNYESDFGWCAPEVDLHYEIVNVQKIRISVEDIKNILNGKNFTVCLYLNLTNQ